MHKTREVRIGLVLYGGVSLAVYINGVAQELFRAVRGHGIYRLLKALLGADIVVDVISGTSAGGLNGIYLAYSMCQPEGAKNFLKFSGLWRNHGDIAKLLRHVGSAQPNSPGIWLLGWDDLPNQLEDPKVSDTAIRDANYDYLTNKVVWAPNDTAHTLPNSLYLTRKPDFFDAGKGSDWKA